MAAVDVPEAIVSALERFTMSELVSILHPIARAARATTRKRGILIAYIASLSAELKAAVLQAASVKVGSKRKAGTTIAAARPSKRMRFDEAIPDAVHLGGLDALIDGPFLQCVSQDTVSSCISRFIDSTSNAALAKAICMVCARKLFMHELVSCDAADIPNMHMLAPTHPHPAHYLYRGAVIHEPAAIASSSYICISCKSRLIRSERPRLSLANNMWIGAVPFVLSILTLPEQILIGLYFPAAYVVKLYPKKANASSWNKETINSGLRGNVSSYRLNTKEISEMVTGNLMPRPLGLLAAVLAVTFVGARNIPLYILPDIFQVRRQRVVDALVWLQTNNHLYADVILSEERIVALPEGGVPEEIYLNARYNFDASVLEREQAGYVPLDEDTGAVDLQEDHRDEAEVRSDDVLIQDMSPVEGFDDSDSVVLDEYEPAVLYLQAHGSVDVGGDAVTDSDLFLHAAANLDHSISRDYAVRKGSSFVNEYPRVRDGQRFSGDSGDANHLLGAFPTLFPYGYGGFEVDREDTVTYEAHTKWALQYADSRFRGALYFMFMAFGVLIKRQVCRSAALQINRSSFIANQAAFLRLTPYDFRVASEEEKKNVPISNPVVRALRRQLTTVRARVMGTDESRISIRAQVWGMTLRFNPPTIWATLNLSDTGDPIAQVLAGEDIDLDRFIATSGPMSEKRAKNIARDPFAAAEFFHLVVRLVLEEMFGITINTRSSITRKPGILGVVNGYVGTVEAQARGTLHLHILLWLQGAPVARDMRAALSSDKFRSKMKAFISANIRAHVDGTTGDSFLLLPKRTNVAYCRPEDPRLPDYPNRAREAESRLVRAAQTHVCKTHTCLKMRKGQLVCKRRAPWTTASDDWVLANGEWGPKRLYGRLNAWNPSLMQVLRCNQDMKLVTNGADTKDITFYITLYIAKRQIQASNASALLAKSLAAKKQLDSRQQHINDVNKRLLQQCTNTLSRQHEFSAPEIVSYLMGWGDRYISHSYVRIYWDQITEVLRKTFPHISASGSSSRTLMDSTMVISNDAVEQDALCVLESTPDGRLVLKDQLKEYRDRGTELSLMSFYDYFTLTYDGKPLGNAETKEASAVLDVDGPEETPGTANGPVGLGRPPSTRVAYIDGSGRSGCRVLRHHRQEMNLHFVGKWFPRETSNSEYYSAQMLLLFKPWRTMTELYAPHASFSHALDVFLAEAPPIVLRTIENIRYFYESSDRASERRDAEESEPITGLNDIRPVPALGVASDGFIGPEPTEDDILMARANRYPAREFIFGHQAVQIAKSHDIFFDEYESVSQQAVVARATIEQMQQYHQWAAKVVAFTRSTNYSMQNSINLGSPDTGGVIDVVEAHGANSVSVDSGGVEDITPPEVDINAGPAVDLNQEQKRAYDIIVSHMLRTRREESPKQLLMIVRGEGGTGKTVLLNAIARAFESYQLSGWLAKTATTGVAASLFGGMTLHSWAGIPIQKKTNNWLSNVRKRVSDKRKNNIVPTRYLVIDEYSMLTQKVLEMLSQILGNVKAEAGQCVASDCFGNVNVILFGDLHQFPPVGSLKQSLFFDEDTADFIPSIGLSLYQQFTTVVTLTEQRRITDAPWIELLRRLRNGACTAADVDIIDTLVVGNPRCQLPSWNKPPWDSVVLVTPRHGVRILWNTEALNKHRSRSGNLVYTSYAEDVVTGIERCFTMQERLSLALTKPQQTGNLDEHVQLAVGMRAMVLFNISTEADLANGTRGEIVDIVLDAREPFPVRSDPRTGHILLRYPPAVVLFKADSSSFPQFEGLPLGVIPIVPSSSKFTIRTANGSTSVTRRQYAITAGYAFTDYKSQGQTISSVLVDLGNPPTGCLTPFSAYVALSRSRGRDNIRILRGFDPKLFTTHPSEQLRKEDARLDGLTLETKALYR